MMSSAADKSPHRAALTAKAEGNLLADKARGPNDEIHRYLHCGSLRGEADSSKFDTLRNDKDLAASLFSYNQAG